MSQAGVLNSSAAGGGGNVVGEPPTVIGDIAVWDNTTATLLKDSGVAIAPVGNNYGTIGIFTQASTGTGLSVRNGTNSPTAGAIVSLTSVGGDALINLASFTTYQIAANAQFGTLLINTMPSVLNQSSGTALMRFTTTSAINLGQGLITTFGGRASFRKAVPLHSVFMNVADYYIGVTSVPDTIVLPTAASLFNVPTVLYEYIIKDESGDAAANNITIVSPDGLNINGSASYVISSNYGSVGIVWNGTQFYTT